MLSIVPIVSSSEVFTHKSLRSREDRSKAKVYDNSNCPFFTNTCLVLVNKIFAVKYKGTTHVLELFGCGTFWVTFELRLPCLVCHVDSIIVIIDVYLLYYLIG